MNKIFKPAFLGRLVISPYFPIRDEAMKKLEGFRLDGIVQKMKCPFLLVHGEGDAQAPTDHAEHMIAACGSANLTRTRSSPCGVIVAALIG